VSFRSVILKSVILKSVILKSVILKSTIVESLVSLNSGKVESTCWNVAQQQYENVINSWKVYQQLECFVVEMASIVGMETENGINIWKVNQMLELRLKLSSTVGKCPQLLECSIVAIGNCINNWNVASIVGMMI